ncbi:MAG: hypothetical protein QXW70_00790 [Candidatus Anstonellales archaeon]
MGKGFIFTLDAVLALFLVFLLLPTMIYLLRGIQPPNSLLLLEKKSNDALAVLGKNGELATLNASSLNASLTNLLRGLSWHLEIKYYNYSGSFLEAGSLSVGSQPPIDSPIIVSSSRLFLVPNPEKGVKYYGIARLSIWQKKKE